MATNQEILNAAGYELGHIEYGASLDATDSADALEALNDMMEEWRETDKDFNWFIQDTLGDTFPVARWAHSGIKSCLAVRLGAVFNTAITAECAKKARDGENVITGRLINMKLKNTDMSHLPIGAARTGKYDIDTDSL